MISIRLVQRILIDIFDLLVGAGILTGYFLLFKSSFIEFEKIGYCIGFLISCSIIVGLISFSEDFLIVMGSVCLIQFVTSIYYATEFIEPIGFWQTMLKYFIAFCVIIALTIAIMIGCMIGIGLKVAIVYLKKENRKDFAEKIALPKELLRRFFLEKEEKEI